MTQQFHFWVFIQQKQNHHLEKVSARSCSLQHYSQHLKTTCVHQQMSRLKNVDYTHTHTHTHTPTHMMCPGIFFSHKKEGHPWEFSGGPVLRVQPFHSWGLASTAGWRTKILPAMWYGQKKEKKEILSFVTTGIYL